MCRSCAAAMVVETAQIESSPVDPIDGPFSLALSGETPTRELLSDFSGVGLIRGEYIFRDAELYPTQPAAQERLFDYLDEICRLTPGTAVYRTMEVTTAEANVLRGVEEVMHEDVPPLMGVRGIRRHLRHPESLSAELRVLRAVRERHQNLVVIAPFVSTVDEYLWFRGRVRSEVGRDCPVGTMVETPAAVLGAAGLVAAGARHIVVGTNDLGSLLAARPRVPGVDTELGPGMAEALRMVRDAGEHQMHVAGYLTPPLIAAARSAGADSCVVHYADLPRLLGRAYADLPQLGHLAEVKKRTRAAIARAAGEQPEERGRPCAD